MRVLIVGDAPGADSLVAALRDADLAVEHRPDDETPPGGAQEVGEIASALREIEALLEAGVDAVVVVSDSAAALAAVVVATKVGTPVALVGGAGAGASEAGANARLIRLLADTALALDAAAIVGWVRARYAPRA